MGAFGLTWARSKRICAALVVLVVLLALASFVAGEVLTRPAHRSVGSPPADHGADAVRIPMSSDEWISGWFSHGAAGRGSILLLHGVRSDRRQMVGRARALHRAGYSVLLIDLPGHGESSGARITFGARESKGVVAALAFLRRKLPLDRIGVIAVSLGAASLVLSVPPARIDAVVLESMYPTIREAAENRLAMRFGRVGAAAAPLLLLQLPLRLDLTGDELRPIDGMSRLGAPVFVISGKGDQHTTEEETKRIYAAASGPKELWIVDGAAHVDLHSHDPRRYEERVFPFLRSYLDPGGKAPAN